MKVLSITLCESCIVDARTNLPSYINVYDEIIPRGIPFEIPHITFVFTFEKEVGDMDAPIPVRILFYVNSNVVNEKSTDISFYGKKINRTIAGVFGFPILEAGILKIVVSLNGSDIYSNSTVINTPP